MPGADALAAAGFAVVPGAAPRDTVETLVAAVEPLLVGVRGGVRDALRIPAVRELAAGPLLGIARAALGPGCVAVNATVFDKAAGRNWKVPYHQDTLVRVRVMRPAPGFGTWCVKGGVHCCRPPAGVLEQMLAVRLHLDDCGPANGPLRVLPGSHTRGLLTAEEADAWPRAGEVTCVAAAGDVVLMRPLLLHASGAAVEPARRRVVHVEYGPPALPGGLAWHDAAG